MLGHASLWFVFIPRAKNQLVSTHKLQSLHVEIFCAPAQDLASAEVNIMHELKQWRGDRGLV